MIRNLFEKKFHDFPEMAAESISAYTKEENGKTVPMWNKEQVNEIVTAQASNNVLDFILQLLLNWTIFPRQHCLCLLAMPQLLMD